MWCTNDKYGFFTVPGQIQPTDDVGKMLIKYVKENTLRTIVDVGTWNGLGSTRCFLIGLEGNSTTNFISIEVNKEKSLVASENLKHMLTSNTKLFWGSILNVDDLKGAFDIFEELKNPEPLRCHLIDIENIKQAPSILSELPDEIDFILFDGGEYTTYFEFKILFPRCKKFIALDDVNVAKCKYVREFLQKHPDWKEIEYTTQRNGFSLFKRSTVH